MPSTPASSRTVATSDAAASTSPLSIARLARDVASKIAASASGVSKSSSIAPRNCRRSRRRAARRRRRRRSRPHAGRARRAGRRLSPPPSSSFAPSSVDAAVVRLQRGEPERVRAVRVERVGERREVAERLRHLLAADGDHARSGSSGVRTRARRPRPAPARSRGAGTRGRRRRRAGRSPRRGARATSPSTRCANPAGPCPRASPRPARPASPPSRARSPSGCAWPRRPRPARPPTRAAPRGCGAAARRSRGTSRRRSRRLSSDGVGVAAVDQLADQLEHPVDVVGGVGHVDRAVARRAGPSRPSTPARSAPASSGSLVPRSAARAMILSSTSVTLLT